MEPIKTDVVVVGAGPGGYAAAFYAADKGKKVILVEKDQRLGGVCLNRGCIPSKALLHAVRLITEARESGNRGISFGDPKIDLNKLRAWKNSILDRLGGGIATLAKQRGVEVMQGCGCFKNSTTLRVETGSGQKFIKFEHAIISVGSKSVMPKAFDLGNPRVMTSREALDVPDVPENLLIVGGGYIGMDLGTVYAALGSKIVLAEALGSILTGADPDLVRPVKRNAEKAFKEVRLKTRVLEMATSGNHIKVVMETNGKQFEELYDRVLVSVGRVPNHADLGLENTKVKKDDRGFIAVNNKQQTDDPAIYAIGDVTGGILLAHKAAREARLAVDALTTGKCNSLEKSIIPVVVFTDPEVAWCGLTETKAKEKGILVTVARFPWSASGRALTFDHSEGLTKLLIDPETERVLGAGITGHGAGELIGEIVLAIQMGATANDLASAIHPHPTLSETIMECAEVFYGHATHTYNRGAPKRAA